MRKLCISITLIAPTAAFAGGYGIPSESPRDLALAEAAVADQTGAEAIFLNTAALAGQEGLNISAAGELLFNRTRWEDDGRSAELIPQTNAPPTAAISFGARLENGMAWGVGAGFGVPGGGSLVWPNGWAGQASIQSVKQQVFQFGIGGAFQPTPYLKIGASLLRLQQVEELHQKIYYLDHYGDAAISASGGGTTFGAAVEVRVPTVPLTFGAYYKHSADITLEGDAHFEAVPPAFQAMIHDQGVTHEVTAPNVFHIGLAYDVMPDLTIMGAYSRENWSVYESDTFVGTDGFTVSVPRDYKDAYVLRLGGEWKNPMFLPALTLRAGLLRSMSDQPSETVSPSLTDGNSTAVSLGAGFNILPELRVDLGWQHAFFDDVTASGDEAFPGTYKTQVDLISLGVNWRVDVLR